VDYIRVYQLFFDSFSRRGNSGSSSIIGLQDNAFRNPGPNTSSKISAVLPQEYGDSY
jgi:hypothetical protein